MATVNLTHSASTSTPLTPFVNEPFVDFTQPENIRGFPRRREMGIVNGIERAPKQGAPKRFRF